MGCATPTVNHRDGCLIPSPARCPAGVWKHPDQMEVPHVPLTSQDLILHLMFFCAALLLMDPMRFVEVLAIVKDKLPITGGGKGGG